MSATFLVTFPDGDGKPQVRFASDEEGAAREAWNEARCTDRRVHVRRVEDAVTEFEMSVEISSEFKRKWTP